MAKSNSQIIRTLLGLILSSDLADLDLRSIQRGLRNGTLANELAELLEALLGHGQRREFIGSLPRTGSSEAEKAEAAIRRRHLSIDDLLDIIRGIEPKAVENVKTDGANVSSILAEFYAHASREAIKNFQLAITTAKIEDPFLKGIRNRS